MTFAEVLEQVIELLQSQKRVSYSTLQTTFDLDDEDIKELQVALIQMRQLAIDADGVALVWTGERPCSTQTDAIASTRSTPTAERRQLTVMHCDMVGAPALARSITPDALLALLRTYRTACHAMITRFEGYVAQHPGTGLRVYFGYPQAHEDDAQRAVRAGLGMVEAIGQLNAHIQQEKGLQLAVYIGVHTDLVVVGVRGDKAGSEPMVVGETPRTAAQLRELAGQNTVVISAATYQLVQGYFVCHDLGPHRLKGRVTPIHVYGVLSESGAHSRLDVVAPTGLTPLVGRQHEVTLLQERWAYTRQGPGHVVLLGGEAGIGKSRLVHVVKECVASEPHRRWECHCSPYYRHSAFYPIIHVLERTLQFVKGEPPADKLHKLETAFVQVGLALQETVPLVAALLSLPLPEDRYAPLTLAPQRQRQQTLETLLTILAAYASRQPTLFIIEDLQWIDASTLELLDMLITQGPPARLLTMLTYRPDFDPLWRDHAHVTRLLLQRLAPQHIEHMARQIAGGKTLPAELLQHLITKTDGIPLFIEEVTKMAIESDLVWEQEAHYVLMGSLPTLTIPNTLQGSLLARLDQSAAGKAVAQLGATIGRSFAHELLRDVSPFDAATLRQGLQYLVETEMLHQRGNTSHPTYVFKHALVQDAAYQSLVRSTRQHYHERIARVLEAQFPDLAATQPELLAHHLTEAGLSAAALPYWQRAAKHTIQRSAHVETIGHLTQGLALVTTLPDTPERTQHELTLYLTLGNTLVKLKGYGTPEVGQAYARARVLCQQIRDPRQMARVLYGLWVFYLTRAEFQTAQELATQLLDLAQLHHDTDSLLRGHNAQGTTLCFLGEFAQAYAHLAQGMACKAPGSLHTDATIPQVANFAYASWALWYMGYPDRALASSQAAQALAQERQHPFSRAIALFYAAILHQLRREPEAAREKADATIALATELEFPVWVAGGMLVRGWALVAQGQQAAGLAQIQEGLAAWRTTGGELIRPSGLAKLAEAHAVGGKPELGLSVLAEALATVNHTGMRYYEAELYRLQGEFVLQSRLGQSGVQTPDAEAEASFRKALQVARQQGAKSLELRTAVSLCCLWQQQGKRQAAAQFLAPMYHWFREGFETADLQEAQALLQTLV